MKPNSEKYLKSRLKAYFPIVYFKISLLIAHLNKRLFRSFVSDKTERTLSATYETRNCVEMSIQSGLFSQWLALVMYADTSIIIILLIFRLWRFV